MYHRGRNVELQRGQAVAIVREIPGGYVVLINLDGSWYEKSADYYMVRRMFGERWYQVVHNGQVGWVFSQFIR